MARAPGRARRLGLLVTIVIVTATIGVALAHRVMHANSAEFIGAGPVASPATAAPAQPPVRMCGSDELSGPPKAPAHAKIIPAGNDASWFAYSLPKNVTYYFEAGVHTLGSSQYSQIDPGDNDRFIGAPGAIITGSGISSYAFGATATNVKIEHLTIEDFTTPGNEGAVTTGSNWIIRYNTIQHIVPGTAIYAGTNSVVERNCLRENGQGAFGTYTTIDTNKLTDGASNVDISDNEISYNDTCNWEAIPDFPITPPSGCRGQGENSGCGCSGGGKFWATYGAYFNDNYVHNNYSVGMWADTDNTGFEIEHNYFSDNYNQALIYEISYNALIRYNTFIGNAVATGAANAGFPESAIYISESGGDSRVPGRYSGTFSIMDNVFTNNWSGVVLWEDANRYCSSSANSSAGSCTLVDPSVANLKTCSDASLIAKEPYFNDCRWRTQNVKVTHNLFRFTNSQVGSRCTAANSCGFNGLFSVYGTYPPYAGYIIPHAITDSQGDSFADNIYDGPWRFVSFSLGDNVSWSQWTHGFAAPDANDRVSGQDAGSTIHA
jgi:Right handed beta helix region